MESRANRSVENTFGPAICSPGIRRSAWFSFTLVGRRPMGSPLNTLGPILRSPRHAPLGVFFIAIGGPQAMLTPSGHGSVRAENWERSRKQVADLLHPADRSFAAQWGRSVTCHSCSDEVSYRFHPSRDHRERFPPERQLINVAPYPGKRSRPTRASAAGQGTRPTLMLAMAPPGPTAQPAEP
jgi:hypothetical protein